MDINYHTVVKKSGRAYESRAAKLSPELKSAIDKLIKFMPEQSENIAYKTITIDV